MSGLRLTPEELSYLKPAVRRAVRDLFEDCANLPSEFPVSGVGINRTFKRRAGTDVRISVMIEVPEHE